MLERQYAELLSAKADLAAADLNGVKYEQRLRDFNAIRRLKKSCAGYQLSLKQTEREMGELKKSDRATRIRCGRLLYAAPG